jgi:hypothetical protein
MKKIIIGALLLSPTLTFAQTSGRFGNIRSLLESLADIVNFLIPAVAALALLYFFYGLAKFILARRDGSDGQDEAKGIMIWGVVALFVMVSVWGLVRFIGDALGIGTTQNRDIDIPGFSNDGR